MPLQHAHVPTGAMPLQGPPPTGSHPWQHPTSSASRRRTPDGRTTFTRVLRAWWAGRLRRLVPRGVAWTAVAFAAVLLAAWVLFADILLTPGVVQVFPGQAPSRDWAHDVIGWVALQITFGLGFASVTLLLLLERARLRWIAVPVAVLSSAITLNMVVSGPGQAPQWIAGIGASGLVAAVLAVLAVLLPRPRVHLAVGAATALVVQWGLVTWVGAIEPTQWVFLRAWIDLAFPTLIVVAFAAILAVAFYAQQVHERADLIGRRILVASWAPVLAASLALVVVLVRMGPLSNLFGDLDANLWGWASWHSWPHAIVVGGLVVWLVARSGRMPLRPRGHVLTILVLAAMAGMAFLSFAATAIVGALGGSEQLSDAVLDVTLVYGNLLGLACTVLLLVPLLVPRFRRSTGRLGAIVAIVVAVPLQLWLILRNDLLMVTLPRFAASPSQIVLVIVVAVLALAIWGAARRRDVVDRHLLLRLAIVPLATAHAGQLLPGVWKDDLEQALIVVLSLLGLLFLGAPRTGTKEGDAIAVVWPFATQVLVLGSVIVARTMGQLMDDETTSIAVLYLTIPVAAVLCCRLEDPRDAWVRGAATVDLETMRRGRALGLVVALEGGWGAPAPVGVGAMGGPPPQPGPVPAPPGPWQGAASPWPPQPPPQR
ncbi:hypothetical protein C1N71_13355 [Agrococcus sp. SGAir0287]|nr:hypothetical protein C1N71_13355 [Agrococcus sp. SGAir0287]